MKLPDPLSLRHPDAASVKASVDLVNYIAQFTRLRLGGRQYVGLCPLPGHRERHPSFQVDATRQIFYCHGCQRGGDVFSFVMYQRGCGFSDAVREVVRFILGEVTAPKARPRALLVGHSEGMSQSLRFSVLNRVHHSRRASSMRRTWLRRRWFLCLYNVE